MKKALAYIVAAVLLGFVVVRLPQYLLPLSPSSAHIMNAPSEQDASKDAISSALRLYGLPAQPSLLPSSLIFFSGLIVALTAYVVIKRRIS